MTRRQCVLGPELRVSASIASIWAQGNGFARACQPHSAGVTKSESVLMALSAEDVPRPYIQLKQLQHYTANCSTLIMFFHQNIRLVP
ncbi:hypothetical protein AKJ16_DCAP05401 [Drosera capensis]